MRPSALQGTVVLKDIEIAGNRQRVEDWLGAPVDSAFDGVGLDFSSPSGYPGVQSVTFVTDKGEVRI